jgi:hypothetical protein
MKSGWVKADRNSNEVLVGDDKFKDGWMPRDMMVEALAEGGRGTNKDW